MKGQRRTVAGTTILAGIAVGVALVELRPADPIAAPGAGPKGPPLAASDAPPVAAPDDSRATSEDLAPAVDGDEDWLDAHLRAAAAVWRAAAEAADQHPDAAVQAQAPAMRALSKEAPAPSAEVPPLQVVVPFLSAELSIWLALPTPVDGLERLESHMSPLFPTKKVVEASRSP